MAFTVTGFFACAMVPLFAQTPQAGRAAGSELVRQGVQLDLAGKGSEARAVFQRAIDVAPTAAAKARAQRAMAMSWAFEGNCRKTVEYEEKVIDYWKSQEKDTPANAFYQQGEMADEAARVCVDNGDLDTAYAFYKKGHDLGMKEPDISAGRKALWEFRWEHAQGRIAARRGNQAEAEQHVAAAQEVLSDMKEAAPELYEQQASFLPYLKGYVALYSGNYKAALEELGKANQRDPFIQCLIGMAYEKLGDQPNALQAYRKAADAGGHNPPAAFAGPFARKKLGER